MSFAPNRMSQMPEDEYPEPTCWHTEFLGAYDPSNAVEGTDVESLSARTLFFRRVALITWEKSNSCVTSVELLFNDETDLLDKFESNPQDESESFVKLNPTEDILSAAICISSANVVKKVSFKTSERSIDVDVNPTNDPVQHSEVKIEDGMKLVGF